MSLHAGSPRQRRRKFKMGRDSLTKLWMLFSDGHKENYYSIDWKHQYSTERDRDIGIERFINNFISKQAKQLPVAKIYCTQDKEKVIKEFRYGIEI